ncbi:MAG TPA: PhzF family phenazine biosynthesis protein [Cellvibrio sp.]|nr:PhzF family phenazine biosynthesis protein [Cellvibrio sp.]
MANAPGQSFIVDAFTDKPFAGNPAAVCILNEEKPLAWLQQIAAEFNLSETAFLQQIEGNRWHLRWFTPICEIKLCGHATLASAHVLLHELHFPYSDIVFYTLSGDLQARACESGIKLDFPRVPCSAMNTEPADIAALKLHQLGSYYAGEDIILELASEEAVLNYQPDLAAIARIAVRGLIITARSATDERDFVSRFFAPRAGVDEDPVTGSAHCSLASLWSEKLGKKTLRAAQLSARGGVLDLIVHPDRVDLIGSCVTLLQGELKHNLF